MKIALLNRATRKLLKDNKTVRCSTHADRVKSTGILFTAVDGPRRSEILRFSEELQRDGIAVKTLEFKSRTAGKSQERNVCSDKDVSFWGIFNNPDAQRFMEQEFDYLFVAEREDYPLIRHILAGSKAKCRAGQANTPLEPYLDLMVSMEGSWSDILHALRDLVRKLH